MSDPHKSYGNRINKPPNAYSKSEMRGCTLPENVSEFDFVKTDTLSAVSEKRAGKGKVISFPYMAGMNFCGGAARKEGTFLDETIVQSGLDELNGTVRYGVPCWMEGDESVRKRIAAVAAGSGAVGQLSLSSGNVDAGVLDDGEKAFAGFANYNLSPVRGFIAEIPLKTRYSRVETLDGSEVKVEWDGTVVRCTFDPADADSIARSILIWLDTKSFPETVVSAPRFIACETP